MLNKLKVLETSWEQLKRHLKEKFAGLSYADLAYEEVRQERMFAMLRFKLGKSKEEFEKILLAL